MSNAAENAPAVARESTGELPATESSPAANTVSAAELEALENVDFLLEEIENKIAPLALAW